MSNIYKCAQMYEKINIMKYKKIQGPVQVAGTKTKLNHVIYRQNLT